MNVALFGLVVWLSAADPQVGTELLYSGTLSQHTKTGDTLVKSFLLHAVIVANSDGHPQLAFELEEKGGGGWSWPEQFGLLPLADQSGSIRQPVRLLQTHEEQQYPIPVRVPLFEFRDKLVPQTMWTDGGRNYLVTRKRNVKNREGLQVEVSSNVGRSQTLIVETASGVLLSLDERVIIGRGDEYQMKMELQTQKLLSAAEIAKTQDCLKLLVELQSRLGRTGDQKNLELKIDQLESLQKDFPRIEKESEGTMWGRLVASIGRDLKQQQKRSQGIAGLQKKRIGEQVPEWKLNLTNGETISGEDLRGKVVVLHFWQYRGEPLNEPYGQIGYLDFLNNKRSKLGVKVIGVNIDERFANRDQSAVAIRSMKKLLEFMNIGYDMAMDDGSVLAELGDPRDVGAPLPLWVVLGHDGKVRHFYSGFYDIKPDEGLRQLDDAVVEALRKIPRN